MIVVANKCTNWIRHSFSRELVNKLAIAIILFYYYIGLLSYITVPIKPIYHFFTSGSSVAVILRALITVVVVLYSLIVVIVNSEKVQWKWLIVFLYILLFTLLSASISPQSYYYVYISRDNFGVVYWVQVQPGFKRLFTMFLSSISDFALAFCFLFVLPLVLNNKKQLLLLTIPIVFIGVGECIYSLIVEKAEYIKLINYTNPEYGGYDISIGASFGNKQDWGAFITVAFACSLASFICLKKTRFKVPICVFLLLTATIFLIMTIASLCKTAIFSELVITMFFLIGLFFYFVRKHYVITASIYASFFLVLVASIVLFYLVPSLHSFGVLEKIYKVTYNFILNKIETGALAGRTTIWLRFVENLRTYNLFFGLSKGAVSSYSQAITVEGQSNLHNGFIYFLASYGIFGFSIYLILLTIVVTRIIKLWKYSPLFMFVLLGFLGAALIFSLIEAEVLIVSGSNPIFVFNILLCVFPEGLLLKLKKERSF